MVKLRWLQTGPVALAGLFMLTCASVAADLRPVDLRTEWLPNPLGIDQPEPRLSWRLQSDARGQKQTACQIRVAASLEALQQDRGDLWDSGRTDSDEGLNIRYAGKRLPAGQLCFWQVKVWDQDGQESAWSEVNRLCPRALGGPVPGWDRRSSRTPAP
jgi:alpha-L-rhamnosidase